MQHAVIQHDGSSQVVELSDIVFSCKFNEPLVHQVICATAASERQGTHAQKNRAEVRGGGKKPWRQKGTGRARAGSIRSPIWRGGGAAFAVKPRDYAQKVNKKMYRGAMRSILSELIKLERLIVLSEFSVNESKTRELVKKLQALDAEHTMIVTSTFDEKLYLASRNLPNIKLCFYPSINVIDLIKYQKTIITLPVLKQIEESLL
jgi:large subunit ribosomal protein L4